MEFNVPVGENKKLETIMDRIKTNVKLDACLRMNNITAIDRLGYNDHGPTHAKIVANMALKIHKIFSEANIPFSLVKDYGMSKEDSEVVVVLGALLHDIGHTIHRTEHEYLGVVVAKDIIEELLKDLYTETQAEQIKWEISHCILSHEEIVPLTVEAGIVKVADALDMEKGRARLPYEAGKIDIHSTSAMAIDEVIVDQTGDPKKPIMLHINMINTAGIFQVDELLRQKIGTSRIKKYFEIEAYLKKDSKFELFKKY